MVPAIDPVRTVTTGRAEKTLSSFKHVFNESKLILTSIGQLKLSTGAKSKRPLLAF